MFSPSGFIPKTWPAPTLADLSNSKTKPDEALYTGTASDPAEQHGVDWVLGGMDCWGDEWYKRMHEKTMEGRVPPSAVDVGSQREAFNRQTNCIGTQIPCFFCATSMPSASMRRSFTRVACAYSSSE